MGGRVESRSTVKVQKASFATGTHSSYCTSAAELDERAWVVEHTNRIADRVRTLHDATLLRQVAALIGYKE